MKQDNILVLDLGSSENTTIARWVRDLGVYSEIHPHDITAGDIQNLKTVKGIILNGGKNNIVDGEAIDVLDEIYSWAAETENSGKQMIWPLYLQASQEV